MTTEDDTAAEARIRDALASHADDFAVACELHDVPPYRVYEVRVEDRRAVLKLDDHPRGHAAAEGRVQGYAADRTSIPVPPVLAVGDDHFFAAWDDRVPQEPEPGDERWARAAGRCLGRLHAETTGDFEGYGRPAASDGELAVDARDDWMRAVRDRLAHHRPFLADAGHVEIADAVDGLLADHPGLLDGAGGPVLCHGDLLPGHLATDEAGEPSAVIDFEHALIAPGEYDFCRTAIPTFGGGDPSEGDLARLQAFRGGYESVRTLPDGFERRRAVYLLVDLVSYVESLYLQGNVEGPERSRRARGMRDAALTDVERVRDRAE